MTETTTTASHSRAQVGPVRVRDASKPAPRQLVRFAFYRVMPEWRRLGRAHKAEQRQELAGVLIDHTSKLLVRTYNLVGTRGDVDFMIWAVSEESERLQALFTDINRTALAGYLTCSHSYTSMTKRSIYVDVDHPNSGRGRDRLVLAPGSRRFLFVYPFVKTRAWWALPAVERQRMMEEHIRIGHQFPSVKINTTYSFGLDDQEFVVAFETDSAADFLDCVQVLRDTEASSYTARDVPSFTCIRTEIPEMLESLG
ncbi:MAG TPA: chlorite dismutase family protein [Candidatus Dormibacteraeota bacterium]|nr:chlorite dismutase family protein [Candidatus Dormibacteraeota bacterium]